MDYGGIYINRDLKVRGGKIGVLCYNRACNTFIHPYSPTHSIRHKVQYSTLKSFNRDKPWAFKAGPSVLVEWGEDDN